MTELIPMDALKHTLKTSNKHGEILLQVMERMENMEKRVEKRVEETEKLVEAVSLKVHLDDGEATAIQQAVNEKATHFANIFFEQKHISPSVNLRLSKIGQMRGNIYRRLKSQFNVVKYTSIKHVDFERAMDYINNIDYMHLMPSELRYTPKQLELLKLEGERKVI